MLDSVKPSAITYLLRHDSPIYTIYSPLDPCLNQGDPLLTYRWEEEVHIRSLYGACRRAVVRSSTLAVGQLACFVWAELSRSGADRLVQSPLGDYFILSAF